VEVKHKEAVCGLSMYKNLYSGTQGRVISVMLKMLLQTDIIE